MIASSSSKKDGRNRFVTKFILLGRISQPGVPVEFLPSRLLRTLPGDDRIRKDARLITESHPFSPKKRDCPTGGWAPRTRLGIFSG